MGDASLPPPQSDLQGHGVIREEDLVDGSLREVNVLVTGFGSFKSFTTNPSYLIASQLAQQLYPESPSNSVALNHLSPPNTQHPIRDPDPRPYRIKILVYPTPVRVAYASVNDLIPKVITGQVPDDVPIPPDGFDYVLHIGMAAGRENYTVETIAHRDHYKLKDVDDRDAVDEEAQWRILGLPEALDVGWNKQDVLSRWEAITRQREDDFEHEELVKSGWKGSKGMTLVEMARLRSQVFLGKGKRAVVKLSKDAGRYLCEFIFFTSLGTRWRQARDTSKAGSGLPSSTSPKEKVGKVAFLHVPGGTGKHDIARGVRVAESLILAVVGSWEDGFRNPAVYGDSQSRKDEGSVSPSGYEVKGTGDR